MKKKNYKIQQTNIIPLLVKSEIDNQALVYNTSKGKVDFNRWNYYGRPVSDKLDNAVWANRSELVFDLFNAITQLGFEMSGTTVEVLAAEGCKQIFQFLDHKAEQQTFIVNVDQFTREVIDEFVIWIRNKPARTVTGKLSILGARRHYTSVKSILSYFIRQGRLTSEIFPYAPFLNVNRSGKSTLAYTKSEMSRIMRFLWQQLALIRDGTFKAPLNQVLSVYALIMAAKSGRNTSTILSLKDKCISPHPLAPDTHIIMTGFKKRGMNTSVQAMRESSDITDTFSTHKDMGTLVREVLEITRGLRAKAKNQSLFLTTNADGNILALVDTAFWKSVQSLYAKALLKDDQGNLLKIQVKRMRKTFAERVWQLSGGDPIKTAKALGNTVPVLDKHYIDVMPNMEKQHKLFGHVLTETLLNTTGNIKQALADKLNVTPAKVNELLIGNFNTSVGRCSDPINGKFAKGDGVACSRFTRCFICPNQVILATDLYRLFSFYWLIKDENAYIGREKWKKLYGTIIHIIENEVSATFSEDIVSHAKVKARANPHPAWKTRVMLERI